MIVSMLAQLRLSTLSPPIIRSAILAPAVSAFVALGATGLAWGQPARPSSPPPATTVRPVTVTGGPAPKLISTWPKDGAEISAGVLTLKLVFDRAMGEDLRLTSLAAPGARAPACLDQPRRLADEKTLVLLCTTAPGTDYALNLGSGSGLDAADGRSADGASLRFKTNAEITDNLVDALSAAGLQPDAEPIMGETEIKANPPTSASGTTP